MSVRHIGLVLDRLEVRPAVKLVALILADHADSDGICWPSYRRIAERACLDERTVRRYVRALIDAGVLTKLRTGTLSTKDGQCVRITNAYRLDDDVLERMPRLELSTGARGKVDAHDHLETAVSCHFKVGRDVHQTVKEQPSYLTVSAVETVDNSTGEVLTAPVFVPRRVDS